MLFSAKITPLIYQSRGLNTNLSFTIIPFTWLEESLLMLRHKISMILLIFTYFTWQSITRDGRKVRWSVTIKSGSWWVGIVEQWDKILGSCLEESTKTLRPTTTFGVSIFQLFNSQKYKGQEMYLQEDKGPLYLPSIIIGY